MSRILGEGEAVMAQEGTEREVEAYV